MKQAILITGGAGYIGSHAAYELANAGEQVIVLDNLCSGFAEAVMAGELIIGDIGDSDLVSRLIEKYNINTVMHFAAHTSVPDSIANPFKYYANNVGKMSKLIQVCLEKKIQHFIYSSSAAIYGIPSNNTAVTEDTPCNPFNPYGRTKLIGEWLLQDSVPLQDMRYVALRYFNVAGTDKANRIGHRNSEVPGLIKIVAEAAVGKRDAVEIYGNDYPTVDGTGVRDYIHVEDLIDAHLKALTYLRKGGQSDTFNCGYGHGYSVKQVIAAMEALIGKTIHTHQLGRRAGDPAEVIADNRKIKKILGWAPHYDDLKLIVESAYQWEAR